MESAVGFALNALDARVYAYKRSRSICKSGDDEWPRRATISPVCSREPCTPDVSRDVGQAEPVLDDLSIDTHRLETRGTAAAVNPFRASASSQINRDA